MKGEASKWEKKDWRYVQRRLTVVITHIMTIPTNYYPKMLKAKPKGVGENTD